jgi:hypothetical protein
LAAAWLEKPECDPALFEGHHAAIVIQEHKARLAIMQRSAELAQMEFEKIPPASVDSALHYRAAYYMAMRVGTATVRGDQEEIASLLPEAFALFERTRKMLGQDFFVHQIAEALVRVKRADEARWLVQEYLSRDRRPGTRVPNYLRRVLE